jgi:hypothetical protein
MNHSARWRSEDFNQMRRGGKKLSNFFNHFYTFFSLFHTFFQIFRNFSTTFDVFKHKLARLVLPHFARFAYLNSPSERIADPRMSLAGTQSVHA